MRGGYIVIDMHGMDIDTGATITGVYNNIESNYHKPLVIHNITKNGVKQADEFVTKITMADPIVITTGSTVYTINSNDGVTCVPFEYGGVKTAVKMVKIPATVTITDGTDDFVFGDYQSAESDFNIWAYYFEENEEIYIPPVPNRQTITSFYAFNAMANGEIPIDINFENPSGRPWGTYTSKIKVAIDIGAESGYTNSRMYFHGVGQISANPQVAIPTLADLVSINTTGEALDLTVGGNVIVVKKLSATNYSIGVCLASEGQKSALVNSKEFTILKSVTDKWTVFEPTELETDENNVIGWNDYDLCEMYTTTTVNLSQPTDGLDGCSLNVLIPNGNSGVKSDKSYLSYATGAYTSGADIIPTGNGVAIAFLTDVPGAWKVVLQATPKSGIESESLCDTYTGISVRLSSGEITEPLYFSGAEGSNALVLTDGKTTSSTTITKDGFTKFRVYKKRGNK